MFSGLRSRLSYANVVATLALFLALTGGTAVALTGSNTVFSDDITNNQVQSEDVRNDDLSGGGLTSRDVRPDALTSSDVSALTGADVNDNALTGADINESSLAKVPDADKLDGLDSSAFEVRCPTGTRFHEGACIETASRAGAPWRTAQTTCRDANRRLPTPAELMNFRLEPGITLAGDHEWTDHIFNDDGQTIAENVAENGDRGFTLLPATNPSDASYRCVATPSG